MKKFLLQFADQILSKEDLKSIKGGFDEITCDRTVEYPDGTTFTEDNVPCSGSHPSDCDRYAEDNCYVGAVCSDIECQWIV